MTDFITHAIIFTVVTRKGALPVVVVHVLLDGGLARPEHVHELRPLEEDGALDEVLCDKSIYPSFNIVRGLQHTILEFSLAT